VDHSQLQIGAYLMAAPNQPRALNVAATTQLRGLAAHAEALGFDSFWLPDHVVMPARYRSAYPYQATPSDRFLRYPFDETAFPEPLTALAYVAGATSHILLGTGVLIVPERHPVLLAKQVATLDALSGGRLLLGVGVGWLREEYDALGVPWPGRGRRMDEHLAAMRLLWTRDEAEFHGEFVDFDPIRCEPKPVRSVPIIVGGHSEAAARRAGQVGDGFMPVTSGVDGDVTALVATMRGAAEAVGRDPDDITLYAGAPADRRRLDELAARGFQHVFIAGFPADHEHAFRWLDDVSAEVLGERSAHR
jgi:probable F420-dependent oxidoreductase